MAGLTGAWRSARQGRGRCLVVEAGYEGEPSIEVDGELEATSREDASAMADPVDELIEHVVRTGGEVDFVEPGSLGDLGHIGLLLR